MVLSLSGWVIAVISCCIWMLRREARAPVWAEGPNFSGPIVVKENFAVGIQTPLTSIYCACSGHSFPLGTGTLAWTPWTKLSLCEFFLERQISPQVPWQSRKIRQWVKIGSQWVPCSLPEIFLPKGDWTYWQSTVGNCANSVLLLGPHCCC